MKKWLIILLTQLLLLSYAARIEDEEGTEEEKTAQFESEAVKSQIDIVISEIGEGEEEDRTAALYGPPPSAAAGGIIAIHPSRRDHLHPGWHGWHPAFAPHNYNHNYNSVRRRRPTRRPARTRNKTYDEEKQLKGCSSHQGGQQQPPQRPQQPRYVPRKQRPTYNSPTTAPTIGESDDDTPVQPRDYFPPPTIVGLLEDEGATALLSLLEQSNMLDQLEREGSYTLFAPTSEALSSLDPSVIRDITEDLSLLEDVMRYHLVPGGKIFTKIMKNDLLAETALEGAKVRFNTANASRAEVLAVNGALLEEGRTDQRASNGVVHFIDDLLYPVPNKALFELLDDDGRFVTLTRALEVAGLTELLGSEEADNALVSLTIFAPTDDAFSRVPQQALDELLEDRSALGALLAGHLVKGTLLSPALAFASLDTIGGGQMRVQARKGKVTVSLGTSKATLVDGDLLATNGAVQVIDRVLL